ncbi:hypothetical protein NFI96_027431 [Prochilodus magdalenae]|nr:hypothetical protein NFI96_027431 [Prochilodus magdalenae]
MHRCQLEKAQFPCFVFVYLTDMGESEVQKISSAITAVFPDLPVAVLNSVIDTLKALGAETTDDLQYITEGDLLPVLKPIQARRLIVSWAQNSSSCFTAGMFMLSIDQEVVNDHHFFRTCLLSAVWQLLLFQHPLPSGTTANTRVPSKLSKCFFSINPERGTKVQWKKNKKVLSVNPRVLTLIADHEWT